MWNTPTQKELKNIPKLYETDNIKLRDKIIHLHFFIGGCDWYIAEYDQERNLFFGFTILNGDTNNAEWGYISFEELKKIKVGFVEIDRDIHWKPKPASEIKNIVTAEGI
ncbi:DUF2958 domain-containing protein [Candidatus Woesearchaeota archaeon]|nr:DUF2958 domain-containing protein [Candidatus Woesearchaeota archaeon]MBD3283354.1 DUF2958 domain-containing protein [Candidatus Pacearchaeota archaeon]